MRGFGVKLVHDRSRLLWAVFERTIAESKAGGLVQRRMEMPDATVQVLQGLMFVVLLVSETLYGRFSFLRPKATK